MKKTFNILGVAAILLLALALAIPHSTVSAAPQSPPTAPACKEGMTTPDKGVLGYEQNKKSKFYNACSLHAILGDKVEVTITDPHPEIRWVGDKFYFVESKTLDFWANGFDILKGDVLPGKFTLIWDKTLGAYIIEGRNLVFSTSTYKPGSK